MTCARRSPSRMETACSQTVCTTRGRRSRCGSRHMRGSPTTPSAPAFSRCSGRSRRSKPTCRSSAWAECARQERYAAGIDRVAGAQATVHVRPRARYIAQQGERLRELGDARPAVFLFVSLRDPERDVATYVSRLAERGPARLAALAARGLLAARSAHAGGERARAGARACRPGARAPGRLPARARRRAASSCSGSCGARSAAALGEPLVDGLHEPRALVFERNGEAVLAPLEGDVLRWTDCSVEHRGTAPADRVRARERAGRRSSCSGRCPSARRSRARAPS